MNLRSTKALVEEEGNSMTELDLTDDIAQSCYHVVYDLGDEMQKNCILIKLGDSQ